MQKKQLEYKLQVSICKWLELKYPRVLFISDTIASLKLTIPQKVRNKYMQKNNFKCPDLIILEPNQKYHGLFIELKIESPFKKDGFIKSNEHLEGQFKSIQDLNKKGYYACFSWSLDMTIDIIEKYMNNNL